MKWRLMLWLIFGEFKMGSTCKETVKHLETTEGNLDERVFKICSRATSKRRVQNTFHSMF